MLNETPGAAAARLFAHKKQEEFKATGLYEYADGNGIEYYRVRMDKGSEKFIRPFHFNGKEFVVGEPSLTSTPLYRLAEILKRPDETVYVTEGEKCVDALRKAGYLATTSGGVSSAGKCDWSPLKDRDVVMWPDNDKPGANYAASVLKALPHAQVIDVDQLGLPPKGDAVDWLQQHDADDIKELALIPGGPSWSEPGRIRAELLPVPAFDAKAMLPEALRDWVVDEADRMPCPPDYIAAAAIVAIGSVIGARCGIKPKSLDDWVCVPNLWGAVVAPPSAKKSPALEAALKPLNRLVAKAIKAHQDEVKEYDGDKLVHKAKRDAIEYHVKAAAKDPEKGDPEELVKDLSGLTEPDQPIMRRYKSNDTTIEKLGEILRENPNGLLIIRDELVGLIASWDKAGHEGDRSFFLEAWNGTGSFDTDRINRGSIFIPNLCCSVLGGIQPDKLTVYLEQAANALANDGMLQRFQVLVYPDPCPWEWRDRTPKRDARTRVNTLFETLADFNPIEWGATADDFVKFPYFRFDDEAKEVFVEWSTDLHSNRIPAEEDPLIVQHLAKYDKLFPALALILHLADDKIGWVSADAADRAAAWCEYLEAHARRCYGLLVDDGLRAAQTLATKIERGKLADEFTARDVKRHHWRHLSDDDLVSSALDWLEDEHWLRGKDVGGTGPGTGRRTRKYTINPRIKDGWL